MLRYLGIVCSSVLLASCEVNKPETDQSLTQFKGQYVYGHEVSSFQPCNSTVAYSIVFPDAEYKRLSAMNPKKVEGLDQPVYVELSGTLSSSANEDRVAADYDAILKVSEVQKVLDSVPDSCVIPQVNDAESGWQNTLAEVSHVEPLGDGTYAYSITYTPSVGVDGKQAEPISQHAFGSARAPVLGQKVEIRYRAQEPVIYELLNELKWRKEN